MDIEQGKVEFERKVLKGGTPYMYLHLTLDFGDQSVSLTDVQFKLAILDALKQLHGEVGKALPVDVLKYNEQKRTAILRIFHSDSVKVWSALTLYGSYSGHPCAFRIHQTSGHLIGLAGNNQLDSL